MFFLCLKFKLSVICSASNFACCYIYLHSVVRHLSACLSSVLFMHLAETIGWIYRFSIWGLSDICPCPWMKGIFWGQTPSQNMQVQIDRQKHWAVA